MSYDPPGRRSKGPEAAALLSDRATRPHCELACSSPGPVTFHFVYGGIYPLL